MRTGELPKWLEKVSILFAPALTLAVLVLSVHCIRAPSVMAWSSLIVLIYLVPPLLWRLLSLAFPLREGVSYLGRREKGSTWIMVHQLQIFYIAFPLFERVLLMIPGAYSAWLRLWGSRIGRRVYWAPEVQLVDRTHLDVGDFAFFGSRVYLSQHIVKRSRGRYLLYFRRIKVGSRALVGSATRVAPGTVIGDGAEIKVVSVLLPNTHVPEGVKYASA